MENETRAVETVQLLFDFSGLMILSVWLFFFMKSPPLVWNKNARNFYAWWRHQMETRSFDVIFDRRLDK